MKSLTKIIALSAFGIFGLNSLGVDAHPEYFTPKNLMAIISEKNPSNKSDDGKKIQDLEKYIDLYVGNGYRKKVFKKALDNISERSALYEPIYAEYAPKFNLSENELEFISNAQEIVESWGDTREVSHAGAVGSMQIMKGTAKIYDMKMNEAVDERTDPIKSKEVSLKYLAEHAEWLGSMDLALISYNAGPTKAGKLKKKGADPLNLTQEDACKETREYVKRVYAVKEILKNPSKYGINSSSKGTIKFQYHKVKAGDSVLALCKKYNLNVEDFMEYNPIRSVRNLNIGYTARIPRRV